MRRSRKHAVWPIAIAAYAITLAHSSDADVLAPPWIDGDDVPLPAWAVSVSPKRGDLVVLDAPSRSGNRRGVTEPGARVPLFGAKRGAGCAGRWLLVGPRAWTCSDAADFSAEDPIAAVASAAVAGSDGLPFRYFFASRDGATAYARLESAGDAAPDRELESGWSVAIVEERVANGERWGRTSHGGWIAMRDLFPARPSLFHGQSLDGTLDVAWVVVEHANVYDAPSLGRPSGSRTRLQTVRAREERKVAGGGAMVRVSDDGAPPEWMLAKDLARPTRATPPAEIGGDATTERWIDVDLATQTLVAFDGVRPIYATLVSTGRGPAKSDSATPPGTHRIWVKIAASTMDNAERDDVGKHYSMEDVPYVQFFDKAVALHGVYWHQQFGHTKSHGCVNLAPLDAKWLFGWTSPRLPLGWAAAYPTPLEKGTLVRVR